MSMEPKWGQLGTCADIVEEINSINLSGLSFLDQINKIQKHFECNVFYTRNSSGQLTYKNNCSVVRYVYSKKYGWVDFHHVFRIFEWAVFRHVHEGYNLEDAAKGAEVSGYSAEMYQYLKGNDSGFAYEDLCSNHVGAMLFCNNYNQMRNWGLTWGDMLNGVCDDLEFSSPEEAPNYDFIPHILDGNVPRIYSSKDCLTGDDLYEAHKTEYCRKNFVTRSKIKEAHDTLPHKRN